ncbi:MAG: BatD family protein, partial [Candidatus Cloacimonadaceae bacterium]|nr:BatD family protein [Candidatus Cloacimonadaceae bacterium]
MHKRLLLSALILFSLCLASAASIKVIGSVNTNHIGINEQLKFTISVQSDEDIRVEEPTLPPIENLTFRNVYTSTSVSTSIINFKASRSYKRDYTFVLLPSRPGRAVLPAITVVAGNRRFTTDPIEIQISDQPTVITPSTPSRRPDPFSAFDPFGSGGY